MSSFYGTGISKSDAQEVTNNHIIFSKTEPTVQQAGDVWVIIGEFADNNEEQGNNNG